MSMATASIKEQQVLLKTPLWAWHKQHDARMVPFAGYDLPVQYAAGVKAEHMQVRENAGLFDVSHMGQVLIRSRDNSDPAAALEKIVPGDICGLATGKMRYTVLLNDKGGILDDLIVTRLGENKLFAVLNASRKEEDIAYIEKMIGDLVQVELLEDKALLALQGPKALEVLERTIPEVSFKGLGFMSSKYAVFEGEDILVSRSGYTGEDGFELSVSKRNAEKLANALLEDGQTVWPIGLGARDSLRLESGFCLYGHDIWEETTPVEAGLLWVIPKQRRTADAGYCGAAVIAAQIKNGTEKKRIGLRPEGRAPIREGVALFDENGTEIGSVTSGGYSPLLEAPIAMGYVASSHAAAGQKILAKMRGKDYPCDVVKMPFITKG
tara:strand:+ start:526 stop:1668 length:1143 start_codon:yes stop_codon:yes gene_type:complete